METLSKGQVLNIVLRTLSLALVILSPVKDIYMLFIYKYLLYIWAQFSNTFVKLNSIWIIAPYFLPLITRSLKFSHYALFKKYQGSTILIDPIKETAQAVRERGKKREQKDMIICRDVKTTTKRNAQEWSLYT